MKTMLLPVMALTLAVSFGCRPAVFIAESELTRARSGPRDALIEVQLDGVPRKVRASALARDFRDDRGRITLQDLGLAKRRAGWGLFGSGLGVLLLSPVFGIITSGDNNRGEFEDGMAIGGTIAAAIVAAGIGFIIVGNQEQSDVFEDTLEPTVGFSVSSSHASLTVTF